MNFNDDDIKIAGDHIIVNKVVNDDSEPVAESILVNRQNGNIDKAKDLANQFLSYFNNDEHFKQLLNIDIKDDTIFVHAKILFAFSVYTCLNKFIYIPIVAQTAASEFLQHLKETDKTFYEELNNSGAFSLYLLCKHDQNTAECIADAFAKLCAYEGDTKIIDLALSLYPHFIFTIKSIIENANFIR